jgi:hypothetical protein
LSNITVQGLAFFLPTIVATIYPEASDRIGNGRNLATSATRFIPPFGLLVWLKWHNKRLEKVDVDHALAGISEKPV